ncbi:GGDEF domain-containing protein [Polynucleobacter sp. MG-28-Ekke-A2]|uniref:GGDEF domain-containing protein n=1 Tax=Polynucleobacter sp. MG-28-Ekke-A2 TaxID=3108276 RepID=UPI002B22EDC6|nr:GGDEF domain-containing protein [Polynucleobacter sp. MG-28-Ekke-A2]MEA9601681.1 GGDEF domain-containing protein [Polynucleobacter sp. MG-28-Ekke-A2]
MIQQIVVGSYLIAVLAQISATVYALNLFFKSKSYRLASGSLALAFGLMVGRRVSPLLLFYAEGHYNPFDAFLALIISLLIFFGIVQVKKIISDLEGKNFILDRSSKLDSLTQALSRSEVFARSELEIERSFRNRDPVAFLMLDIDHFKNINDEYGHLLGDTVLANLVKNCQEELRAIDIFGRVGGEEFFVVLHGDSVEAAFEVAERLRKKVFSLPSAVVDGKEVFVSISIGVAGFSPISCGDTRAGSVLRSFYFKADKAMYLAKSKGRNRTEVWS